MAQPRSKERSTRDDESGLKQREYRDEQGRVHHHTRKYMEAGDEASQSDERQSRRSKRRSEPSDRGSSIGNLAKSIADRRGSILLAAAAAAGTLLMSRWLGENGWVRRSLGRGGDDEGFIPGGSWAEAQVPANWNEAHALEPAKIDRGGVPGEAGFEVAQASQQDAVAQAGAQSQGSASQGQGNAQAAPDSSSSRIETLTG